MFDAYKTEQEIKENVVDFLLDWKNVRNQEVRDKLTSLWKADTPSDGSLLSELLIENNFSYVYGEHSATTETLNPTFFKGFLEHLSIRENILLEKKFPLLKNGRPYFSGKKNLQEDFLKIIADNGFKAATPLFQHQVKAIEAAISGKDFILSSGTGSGKTEAFLLPLLAKLFNETDEERKKSGVRVLIIYPMNALINSQVTRLQSLIGVQDFKREPIRFALYNSKLENSKNRNNVYREESPDYSRWPDLQVIDREELRRDPPHILVTNYSMLEYALIRPKDLPIFDQDRQKLHTIILDEAHTYIGAMAAEIAMLIRRILIAFNKKSSEVQFYATSATLGDPDKDNGYTLRKFASDLFSKEIESIDYIDGERTLPLKVVNYKKPIPTSTLLQLLSELEQLEGEESDDHKLQLVKKYVPEKEFHSLADTLYQLFSRNEQIVKLVNGLSKKPLTIVNVAKELGIGNQDNALQLAFIFVNYLSIIESKNPDKPKVKIRLHSVVEAPSGVFVCPICQSFYGSYQEHCTHDECMKEPLRELVICKKCGEPYLCNQINRDGKVERINWREKVDRKSLQVTTLEGLEADVMQCMVCGDKDTSHGLDEEDEDLFATDKEITDPEVVYYKQSYFSPLSVSIDVIQKIVIDTLYANLEPHPNMENIWLPGNGRRLLTFSDSRQGAAKLPTALDWLHEVYLGNRLIYEACKKAIKNKNNQPTDIFSGFSHIGTSWISIFHTSRSIIEKIVETMANVPKEFLIEAIDQELAKASNLLNYIPGSYEKPQLVEDILNSLSYETDNSVSFCEVISSLATLPELKELVGFYDQIAEDKSYENHNYNESIAFWLLSRSLGIISSSRYLPENAGLCYISFPLPPHFIEELQKEEAFKTYSKEAVEQVVQALLIRMRDTGNVFVEYPKTDSDPLYSVASYCFQNVVLNKYMVLEHSLVPNETSMVTNWYNLNLNRETAGIQIVKKSLKDDSISISTAQNILATAWNLMVERLPFLVKHPIYNHAYSLDIRFAQLSLDPSVYRCKSCGRFSPHHINGMCLTPSCNGVVEMMESEQVSNLYGNKRAKSFPQLGMRTVEHTAQLDLSQLTTNEKKFIEGEINLLSSSTTMELGIDIGGLTSILLTNCPPGPSNYLQRAGRAGRRSDRVAYVLTCARKVPLDHYFFLHPDLFFTRKPHDPYVSLNSEKIIKRHVNSYILREFFTETAREDPSFKISSGSNPLASYGTVEMFFGYESTRYLERPIIDLLIEWLGRNPAPPLRDLEFLLHKSDLVYSYNKDSLLYDVKSFFEEKKEMITIYIEDITRAIYDEQNGRRKRVLEYHKRDFLVKDIVKFLIDSSFLPKYGFPVDIAALNTLNYASKIGDPDAVTHKKNRFRLERGSDIAIAEYAPGAQIVAGKRLLTSRGISLDSTFGGEFVSAKGSSLERLTYVVCKNCGNFYVLPATNSAMPCPVCKTAIREYSPLDGEEIGNRIENHSNFAILPKGFRVDYSEPQPFAPNKIEYNRASTRIYPELHSDPLDFVQIIPDLLSIASTSSANFYAVNQGPHNKGYTICNSCGRTAAEKDFGKGNPLLNHKRLYSDKLCLGNNPSHSQSLVSRFVTDAIQIRFAGDALPDTEKFDDGHKFMKTFGRCLQLAVAKSLGLDDRELKFIVQSYWDPASGKWNNLEIILYDNVPGGAGYAEMVMDLFGSPDFYDVLLSTTLCPEECSEACPACLIAYERDGDGVISYNRHLVKDFLERDDIASFFKNYVGTVKPQQGDCTVRDIIKDIASILRSKEKGKVTLFFNALPDDKFAIVESKFGILLEIARLGIDVTIVFHEEPALHLNRQMIENLRYGVDYSNKNIHLKLQSHNKNKKIIAHVEFDDQSFIYESFALPKQEGTITPFTLFPFVRRIKKMGDSSLLTTQDWILPPNPAGMISFRSKQTRTGSIDDVHLYSYLCSKLSLNSLKNIAKVWYSDRYLLRIAENISFLMLLEDMPLIPFAEINIAVNGDRSSYSEFSFQERDDQRQFLVKQIQMWDSQTPILKMCVTTGRSDALDPGNAHDREMLIEYEDSSTVKLSFDSGMSLFSPFIDRNWDKYRTSYKEMIKWCKNNLRKDSSLSSSLIFKYPDSFDEISLDTRFKEAMSKGGIKLLQ